MNNLFFREAQKEDISFLHEYAQNADYKKYVKGILSPNNSKKIEDILNQIKIIEFRNRSIGFLELDGFNDRNLFINLNIYVVPEFRNSIIVGKVLFTSLKLTFELYKVHKISILVYADNIKMNTILKKRGIVLEATLRKRIADGRDSYKDVNVYGILETEFRKFYLRQKYS